MLTRMRTFPEGNGFKGRVLERLFLPRTLSRFDRDRLDAEAEDAPLVGVTLGMKNLFGVVPSVKYGWPKNLLHVNGIVRSIVELAATIPVAYTHHRRHRGDGRKRTHRRHRRAVALPALRPLGVLRGLGGDPGDGSRPGKAPGHGARFGDGSRTSGESADGGREPDNAATLVRAPAAIRRAANLTNGSRPEPSCRVTGVPGDIHFVRLLPPGGRVEPKRPLRAGSRAGRGGPVCHRLLPGLRSDRSSRRLSRAIVHGGQVSIDGTCTRSPGATPTRGRVCATRADGSTDARRRIGGGERRRHLRCRSSLPEQGSGHDSPGGPCLPFDSSAGSDLQA